MRPTLLLARRYLAHHPVRTVALVVAVALTLFLPFAVQLVAARYGRSLTARAEATPLVLGAPGSRYDLVLQTLYFRGRTPRPLPWAELERLRDDELALCLPLFTALTAGSRPLVGTAPEYFEVRGLVPASGALPLWLGDCALGAEAAAALGLGPGDALLTDREHSYDLAAGYPLRMRVTGVLAPRGTPDDGAVFCDLKTAWLAAGLAHGHGVAAEQAAQAVISRGPDGNVVLGPSVVEYEEVTPENRAGFHLHGGPEDWPVTGAVLVPVDRRARTLLKGRFRVEQRAQLLEPPVVMGELLGLVFRVKVLFDANAALVLGAAGLFLAVVVALSLALRARERRTLFRLGCARATVARLMATELGLVLAAGAALAALGAGLFVTLAARALGPL